MEQSLPYMQFNVHALFHQLRVREQCSAEREIASTGDQQRRGELGQDLGELIGDTIGSF